MCALWSILINLFFPWTDNLYSHINRWPSFTSTGDFKLCENIPMSSDFHEGPVSSSDGGMPGIESNLVFVLRWRCSNNRITRASASALFLKYLFALIECVWQFLTSADQSNWFSIFLLNLVVCFCPGPGFLSFHTANDVGVHFIRIFYTPHYHYNIVVFPELWSSTLNVFHFIFPLLSIIDKYHHRLGAKRDCNQSPVLLCSNSELDRLSFPV